MTPYWTSHDGRHVLYHGDCLAVLPALAPGSVDAVVTDPPYGLSFMGKKWDYDVPSQALWEAALVACKPGAHLLAFAGTRTQHRMACRIEDAGWEIRDMIAWVYGSGFPKSLNVSKAIDKAAGAEREVVSERPAFGIGGKGCLNGHAPGATVKQDAGPATPAARQWNGYGTAMKPSHEDVTWAVKPLDFARHCAIMIASLSERIESCKSTAKSVAKSSGPSPASEPRAKPSIAPAPVVTPTEGVPGSATATGRADGTSSRADTSALPPPPENIVLSTLLSWRRTLEGVYSAAKMSTTETAFETTIDWKTLSFCLSQITPAGIHAVSCNPSGLSADAYPAERYLSASLACCANTLTLFALAPAMSLEADACQAKAVSPALEPLTMARKPLAGTVAANVLEHGTGALNIDGCRVGTEDNRSRPPGRVAQSTWDLSYRQHDSESHAQGRWPANLIHDGSAEVLALFPDDGEASAARFFYTAKASKADRDGGCRALAVQYSGRHGGTKGQESFARNHHPTVKPSDLMAYLVRLVTPPGGLVLDPFAGSGTTGVACIREGARSILIERDAAYLPIIIARMEAELAQPMLIAPTATPETQGELL